MATGNSPVEVNSELVRMHRPSLSPKVVLRNRNGIFQHHSQKYRPISSRDDEREFWIGAQERNRETAINYHNLGLANYEAVEAFVG